MKHLNLLAKLENIIALIQKAGKDCSMSTSSPTGGGTGGKPFRGHVLHTACLLHAGIQILDLPCRDGKFIYEKIFDFVLKNIQLITIEGGSLFITRNELEGFPIDRKKRFINDLWILTALTHDIGYLPLIEMITYNVRKGDQLEPRSYQDLREWISNVRDAISNSIRGDNIKLGDNLKDYLPTVNYSDPDKNTIDVSPEKFHGLISGYMILKYLTQRKNGPWNKLSPVEKFMAFSTCSAAMFHCVKTKKIDDLNTWQINPLGAFLKTIDIAQEWVRVVWIHCDYKDGKDLMNHAESKINKLNGLSILLGQCPIPETEIKIEHGSIILEYKVTSDQQYVKGDKSQGKWDPDAMMDDEKTVQLKDALRLLTGYDAVVK